MERDPKTDLYTGWIPGFAHSEGDTRDELNDDLREVAEMPLQS